MSLCEQTIYKQSKQSKKTAGRMAGRPSAAEMISRAVPDHTDGATPQSGSVVGSVILHDSLYAAELC